MAQEFEYCEGSHEDDVFSKGYFIVPHGIFDMTSKDDKYISKSAGILLVVLLHFENRKTTAPNQWFECDDREIFKTKFVNSKEMLRGGLKDLIEHKLLDVEVGTKHRTTKYRIRIPGKYYYKKWLIKEKANAV